MQRTIRGGKKCFFFNEAHVASKRQNMADKTSKKHVRWNIRNRVNLKFKDRAKVALITTNKEKMCMKIDG